MLQSLASAVETTLRPVQWLAVFRGTRWDLCKVLQVLDRDRNTSTIQCFMETSHTEDDLGVCYIGLEADQRLRLRRRQHKW